MVHRHRKGAIHIACVLPPCRGPPERFTLYHSLDALALQRLVLSIPMSYLCGYLQASVALHPHEYALRRELPDLPSWVPASFLPDHRACSIEEMLQILRHSGLFSSADIGMLAVDPEVLAQLPKYRNQPTCSPATYQFRCPPNDLNLRDSETT